ncbi:MAG: pilus assembly protein [Lentisphaeria bacterium]|nr:pilus assembly protein [Lentisphaeria bacterium]
MKAGLKKFFLLQRGSVLMEFVLVLPVYLAVLGGILWMGFRSLDAIGLRSADRWGAWMAGERFAPRVPALTALQSVFPRTYIIHTSVDRALVGPQSFLQFIGSRAEIGSTMPDYIDGWLNMPSNMYGDESSFFKLPSLFMGSSWYGNKYTHFVVMRTLNSRSSKRHWHPGLVASHKIWDIEENNKGDVLPKEWKQELLSKAKHKSDTEEEKKEPGKVKFYERFGIYKTWSK